jgi:hypothetical protein
VPQLGLDRTFESNIANQNDEEIEEEEEDDVLADQNRVLIVEEVIEEEKGTLEKKHEQHGLTKHH